MDFKNMSLEELESYHAELDRRHAELVAEWMSMAAIEAEGAYGFRDSHETDSDAVWSGWENLRGMLDDAGIDAWVAEQVLKAYAADAAAAFGVDYING